MVSLLTARCLRNSFKAFTKTWCLNHSFYIFWKKHFPISHSIIHLSINDLSIYLSMFLPLVDIDSAVFLFNNLHDNILRQPGLLQKYRAIILKKIDHNGLCKIQVCATYVNTNPSRERLERLVWYGYVVFHPIIFYHNIILFSF